MSKLHDHFEAMQAMVVRYLIPEPYTSQAPGCTPASHDKGDTVARDNLFIADMIYMLDGPEQRAAEEAHAEDMRGLEQAAEWRMDIRKQVEQADAVAKGWMDKAKQADTDNNDLRSRLMDSELAYAKLRGYLEGRRDSEPPRMVAEQREPSWMSMPDGSRGTDMGGWAGDGRQSKKWFHR